eukprot:359690-Chlamydomonas_euryale.AAC.3
MRRAPAVRRTRTTTWVAGAHVPCTSPSLCRRCVGNVGATACPPLSKIWLDGQADDQIPLLNAGVARAGKNVCMAATPRRSKPAAPAPVQDRVGSPLFMPRYATSG